MICTELRKWQWTGLGRWFCTYSHSPGWSHFPWIASQPRLQTAGIGTELRLNHGSMEQVVKMELTLFTIGSLPSGDANFVAFIAARVMPKLIVARPTKRGARCVVVIFRALNTNSVREIGKQKQKIIISEVKSWWMQTAKSQKNNRECRTKESVWRGLWKIHKTVHPHSNCFRWPHGTHHRCWSTLFTCTLFVHFCQCDPMYSIRAMAK